MRKKNIKEYKEEIQAIINNIPAEDRLTYEKYSDLAFYNDSISLLNKENDINDQDREIINILLQKEYKEFQKALEKEKKAREKDPHRCSLYKKNEENINKYLDGIRGVVTSIEEKDISKITEDQNKSYEKLIENINFEIDYNEKSFANTCLTNLQIQLEELEDICEVLNKEEKKQIKSYYAALKKEYNLRKKNPAREYQWYINANSEKIEQLQKNVQVLTAKIHENKKDDDTYEQYFDILSASDDNKNILNQLILRDNHYKDLDAGKLVDYLKNHLDALRKTFEGEAAQRKTDSERCFIGKSNKDNITAYNDAVTQFIQDLTDTTKITEKINKQYEDIYAFLDDQEKEQKNQQKIHNDLKELFFAHSSNIFEIGYQNYNVIEVYSILNFNNKMKVESFLKKIHEEINARKSDSKRAFEWYINDNELQDNIQIINKKILAFLQACEKNNFEVENLETLYLVYCNAKNQHDNKELSDEALVKLLAENCWVDLKDVIVENIKYHIDLKLFKEAIRKEQHARLQKPERSYYYQKNKNNIETIFKNIDSWNAVLGDSRGEVSQEVNGFYHNITAEFIFEASTLENKQLFLNKICVFLNIGDYEKILFLLSGAQIQEIDHLYNKIKKEIELRKVYASRALSSEGKENLVKFRDELKKYIDNLANTSLVTNQQAVNALGNSVAVYTGSLLYEELFKVFKIEDSNGSVSRFLDEDDKNKITSLQGLLKEAQAKINTQKDELEREKRLLEHVASVSQMQYTNYIVDGITERAEIEEINEKIKNKQLQIEEVGKEGDLELEKISEKIAEAEGVAKEAYISVFKNLFKFRESLKKSMDDFHGADGKKKFFEAYQKWYQKDQQITFFDEKDLQSLFHFNLGIKSNFRFGYKEDFFTNLYKLANFRNSKNTITEDNASLEYTNDDNLKNQINVIFFIID